MTLKRIVAITVGIAAAFGAAYPLTMAHANSLPPLISKASMDPAFDQLASQRALLLTTSNRLFSMLTSFYQLARKQGQVTKTVIDRYNGRRTLLVPVDNQKAGLAATGHLLNAASQFARFQAQLRDCGVYERRTGACDRSLNRELALLRNVRMEFSNFRSKVNQLNASKLASGQQLITLITRAQGGLVTIYRHAGLIEKPPTSKPVPAPQPQPQPQPQPLPPTVPNVPSVPQDNLNKARTLADQLAAQARVLQQQAETFRQDSNDKQLVEAIDALVQDSESLVAQLKSQKTEDARFIAEQLEVQFNATVTAVQVNLERSNDLSSISQGLTQMDPLVRQLIALIGTTSAGDTSTIPSAPGGYAPGDKPPY